jgi:hypothetical protein
MPIVHVFISKYRGCEQSSMKITYTPVNETGQVYVPNKVLSLVGKGSGGSHASQTNQSIVNEFSIPQDKANPMIGNGENYQVLCENRNPTEHLGFIGKQSTVQNNVWPDQTVEARNNRIKAEPSKKPAEAPRCMRFNVGDSVKVYPQRDIGIVYRKANGKGEVGVQVQKKKLLVNHKRLKLQVPASELYPDDYDFSIIFDSVANRKARRVLEKKHDPNLVIESDTNEIW